MMFIMKAALESEYASLTLNGWIDLVFGYQQKGEEAEKAANVYYHLCYEENVDWSAYKVTVFQCFIFFSIYASNLR